ncbi:MAG: tripartite tricarboxylate transporter substrate binding protein [Rhizobiales bacterium]|nr:tripartite tricarboxylate transporter substrate binding protein [Hyphomicrobiales bacterium]
MENTMSGMKRLIGAVLALLLSGTLAAAQTASNAASFPNRPIRIVVPFPAGGPTDILSRIVAQRMSEDWGQPIVIENRPGANTNIGAQMVARAAPDGYTLLSAMDTTMVMNPASGASMPYDPFKDFAPVTLLAKNTSLLTVRAADGPKTVKELIARGKASEKKLSYGAGITITRLAGYQFARMAGFEVVLIPYKGSSEVVHGLLSGSVDFIVDGVASSLPLIQSGKFRALAKLNNRPLPSLPDLQPLSQAAGLPHLGEMSSWIGLVAPAGTPPAVVEKIRAEVARIYADPVIADKLAKVGISAVSSTPAEFDQFYRGEAALWTKVFKDSPLKLH